MISICMATYNGEQYIEKQLESILLQTKKADEIVICDDNSTDATVEIIKKFVEKNQLQDLIKLYENKENKGYPGNFYYAMSLCTKDFIFLSDQDDIWAENKLEEMSKLLEQHSEMQVLCCKLSLIDEKGEDLRGLMAPDKKTGSGETVGISLEEVFRKTQWQGMVMAYKREWYEENCKREYGIPHDFLIAVRAAEEGGLYQLDQILAYHRRHDHNVGQEEHRVGKLLQKQRKLKEIQDYINMLQMIYEQDAVKHDEGKRVLQKKMDSMKGRLESLKSGKWSHVIKNARKNKDQVRLATFLCDLWIVKSR